MALQSNLSILLCRCLGKTDNRWSLQANLPFVVMQNRLSDSFQGSPFASADFTCEMCKKLKKGIISLI